MKCKHCKFTTGELKELRLHFSKKHQTEARRLHEQLSIWDVEHTAEAKPKHQGSKSLERQVLGLASDVGQESAVVGIGGNTEEGVGWGKRQGE